MASQTFDLTGVGNQDSTAIAVAAGFQDSKVEAAGWFDPPNGVVASRIEVGAILEAPPGLMASKVEVGAWPDAPSQSDWSAIEVSAWLDVKSNTRRRNAVMTVN